MGLALERIMMYWQLNLEYKARKNDRHFKK
jgi:hypothetical protein